VSATVPSSPHRRRPRLLRLTALVLLAGCGPPSAGARQAPAASTGEMPAARPNIVFVFTDDHAAQAIGAYGSVINETPNIDRLAREGMLFRNVFVTNSICGPSRAVIQTGKHSHLNGFTGNEARFDSSQVTFPKLLQQAGYQTAVIGKWHLVSQPMGFDHWEILPGQGDYYSPDFLVPGGRVREAGYVTDVITDKVLAWLRRERDPDRPFMLMYQHKAPHRTWMPGPDHLTLYDGVEIPEPPTLFDYHAGLASGAATSEMSIAAHLHPSYDLKLPFGEIGDGLDQAARRNYERMDAAQRAAWDAAYGPENDAFRQANLQGAELVRWKFQRYIKDYLRTVASVDDNLGRLLEYLDQSGLAENTVVIYSSDQGFFLGENGWYDKRWMYEESLRMPFVVRWPGVTAPGSVNADLVQNLDFAATFLDMAGVAVHREMQGRSIVPLLRGWTPPDWRRSVYYHYYEFPGEHRVPRHYGVRTARYKLVHYYQLGEWELFDLERDPNEQRSVYAAAEYGSVVDELKRELARLRAHYQVPDEDPRPSR
jgi:arylsulfatase A-like enzyme